MKLSCPLCLQEVSAEDINLVREVAKCSACNNVFSFSDKLREFAAASAPRQTIDTPSRFQIQNGPDGFSIIRPWFRPAVFFFLFFAIFWNAIVGSFVVKIVMSGNWGTLWPASFHILAGLAVGYGCLAMFINRTRISVTYDVLRVQHGPLPMPGGKVVPRSDVKQLYSDERVTYGKHGRHVRYGVKVILRNGGEIDLVDGLSERKEALFIEQQVEKFTGIKDEAVRDELPR